ncbi:hypothetical protein B0J18DRAFT_133505 [Chaetomium sp. MPI-SDFR-AT-0129]|nr:hypothetical protein B0J18DRAFT_133505 [Chaetomium sp. MPI-SDFR-AT-0129]
MTPQIRIVVKDRGLLPAAMPFKPQPQNPPRSKRGDLALLRLGVDIALEYFNNADGSVPMSTLTTKARLWADRYFKGYPYAAKRPTALLRTFPNLFNLGIEPHLRLTPQVMSPPTSPEPEGASPRELRRIERHAMNSEAFPEFAEPTLASDADLDRIIELPNRRTMPATKPNMRVDASMLRGSGLMGTLPEFLGQLARANLETETALANNPSAVRFELDDDQAASQQHVEMNLFAGLVQGQGQRRRQQRPIVLPGDLAVKPFGFAQQSSSSSEDDSGDETDASTSTTASLRANLKKRKNSERDDEDSDDSSSDSSADGPPNKIRLHYHHPTPKIRHFDMKRRKLVSRPNPDAGTNDPFEALSKLKTQKNTPTTVDASDKCITVATTDERPNSSSSSNSNSSTRSSPVPISRIRVRSRSPDGSRSLSPDRIIVLKHPVMPSSSRDPSEGPDSSASSTSSSSPSPERPRTKIRVVQRDMKANLGSRKRVLIEEVA